MKIADALLIQKDISKEVGRLEELAKGRAHEWMTKPAGETYLPTFDLEANHKRIMHLQKLHRRLSRAITQANNTLDLALKEEDYQSFL